MKNFWLKLNNPIYSLAPMAGVADSAFRQVCKSYGADVVYSEMASAAALCYQPKKTLELLKFDEGERPYAVQLFGSEPKQFSLAAKIVAKEIEPDGIDINFGCPVPKVAKQKSGAELFKDKKKSKKVIQEVIESTDLPVSIKVRTKAGATSILSFLDYVSDLDIKTVMIHGRTLIQGFSGKVDTDTIKKARDFFGGIILANGGVYNYGDAKRLLAETGADGIGIAQGALGRPWIFKAVRTGQSIDRSRQAIFKAAIKHAKLAHKLKGEAGIREMRKHLCWYIKGLPGSRVLREELVKVETLDDVRKILK